MPVTVGGGLTFCGRELKPEELDPIRVSLQANVDGARPGGMNSAMCRRRSLAQSAITFPSNYSCSTPSATAMCSGYIQRCHYPGYKVPYGAQLRYFVRSLQPRCPLLACWRPGNCLAIGWRLIALSRCWSR